MGEIVYQYDDLDRTINSKSGLNLSCICCEDSFSYLIQAVGDTQHFRAKSIVFDKRYPGFSKPLGYLSQVLRGDRLMFDDFQSKTIAIRGIPFAFVTQDQLAEGNPESFLNSQTDIGPNDVIHSDMVGGTDYTVLFAIPELLNAEIQMYYKNARIRHSISSLMCRALTGLNDDTCTIHANITHRWLEIVIVENKSLKYINHMRWFDQNDIVYYIAALYDNLHLNQKTAFQFSGSAYQAEMQHHLTDHLSLGDDQFVLDSLDKAKVLDLRTIGLCE